MIRRKEFLEELLKNKEIQNQGLVKKLYNLADLLEYGERILDQLNCPEGYLITYSTLAMKAIFSHDPQDYSNFYNFLKFLKGLSKKPHPYEIN